MSEVRLSWKLAAEFVGTAALVVCGPGAATAAGVLARSSGVPLSMAQLGVVALAFMMVLVAMIYTIGHISGCHINPAVTLALAVFTSPAPDRILAATKAVDAGAGVLYIVKNYTGDVLNFVGNYVTSLEMAGCSITVCRLTPRLVELWDAPVDTPALRWGRRTRTGRPTVERAVGRASVPTVPARTTPDSGPTSQIHVSWRG